MPPYSILTRPHPTTMSLPFCLRAATADDRAFIFAAYKTTLMHYVDWAWGWDEAQQLSTFWQHHPLEQLHIVMVEDAPAGLIHVEEQAGLHFVRMILLLPAFQGLGIGSQLLRDEVARARALDKPLHLKVIKINHLAKRLYDRLGFTVIDEDQVTFHLRASAATPAC